MTARATTYDELKEAIAARLPDAVAAAAAPVALRAREAARPRARHRRRGRAGERGAAVVDDPVRQRARLRRLLADAAGVPEPPGRALDAVPRAHPDDAARRRGRAGRRRAAPVRRRGDRRAAASSRSTSTPARWPRPRACSSSAPQIHVLAQRRAFPVACYLAYALNQLELPAHLLDGLGGMLGEFAHGIRAGDALLVASFRNYTPAVVETALACRARGVSVIAITDSALSPLKPAADVCFELGDDSTRPFRSLVAPLCLAQALVVSTGHQLAAPPRAAKPRRAAAAKPAMTSARAPVSAAPGAAVRRRLHGPRRGRPVRRADRRPARGHALVREVPRRLAGQHRGRRRPARPEAGDADPRRRRAQRPLRARAARRRRRRRRATSRPIRSG